MATTGRAHKYAPELAVFRAGEREDQQRGRERDQQEAAVVHVRTVLAPGGERPHQDGERHHSRGADRLRWARRTDPWSQRQQDREERADHEVLTARVGAVERVHAVR